MSYSAVGSSEALGKVFTATLKTPFGDKAFSMDVPYEKLAEGAVGFVKDKAMESLPGLLKMAKDEAMKMVPEVLPKVLDPALKQAGGYVTSTLWPQMQPKIRVEADRAVGLATRNAAIIAGGLILAVFGAAYWVRTKR